MELSNNRLAPMDVPKSLSTFETRDRNYRFGVSWDHNEGEIRRQKQKIQSLKADRKGSKFRLYGRWAHGGIFTRRVLAIDNWQLMDW